MVTPAVLPFLSPEEDPSEYRGGTSLGILLDMNSYFSIWASFHLLVAIR
jgi:hypothetical protein